MLPTAGVRPAGRVPADGARVRWHERGVREPVGGALRTGGGRGEPSGAGGLILTNTDGLILTNTGWVDTNQHWVG